MSLQLPEDEKLLTKLKKIWSKWENLEFPDSVWNKLMGNTQVAEKELSQVVRLNMDAETLNWNDAKIIGGKHGLWFGRTAKASFFIGFHYGTLNKESGFIDFSKEELPDEEGRLLNEANKDIYNEYVNLLSLLNKKGIISEDDMVGMVKKYSVVLMVMALRSFKDGVDFSKRIK